MEDSNPGKTGIHKFKELELKHIQACEYVARFEPPATDKEGAPHALPATQQKSQEGRARRIYNGVRSIIGPWGSKRSVSEPIGREVQTDVDHTGEPSKQPARKSDPLNRLVPQQMPSECSNDAREVDTALNVPASHQQPPQIPNSTKPSRVQQSVNTLKSEPQNSSQMGKQNQKIQRTAPVRQPAQKTKAQPVPSTSQHTLGSQASAITRVRSSFEVYRDQETVEAQPSVRAPRVPAVAKSGPVKRARQAPRAHRTGRIQKPPPVRQPQKAPQARKNPQAPQAEQVVQALHTPKPLRTRQPPQEPRPQQLPKAPETPKISEAARTARATPASQIRKDPQTSQAAKAAQPGEPVQRKPLNAHLVEKLNGQRPLSAAMTRPSTGRTNSLKKNPSHSSVIDRLLQPTRASAAKSNSRKLPFEGDDSRNNSRNSLGLRNSSSRMPRTLSSTRNVSNAGINSYAQNVSLLRKPAGAANAAQPAKRHPLAQVHANKQKAQPKPTRPTRPAKALEPVKPVPAKLAERVKPVDVSTPPKVVKPVEPAPVSLKRGNQVDGRKLGLPQQKKATSPNPEPEGVSQNIKGKPTEAAKIVDSTPSRKRSYQSDEPSIAPPKAKKTRNTLELEKALKDIQAQPSLPKVAKPLFAHGIGTNKQNAGSQAPPILPRQGMLSQSDCPFTPRTAERRRQQNAKLPPLDLELLRTTNQDIIEEYKLDMKVPDSSWCPSPLGSAHNTPSKLPMTPMKLNQQKKLPPSSFPMPKLLVGNQMSNSTPYKATNGQQANLVPIQLNIQEAEPIAAESSKDKFSGNSDVDLSGSFPPAEWAKGDNLNELFAQQGERPSLKDPKKLGIRLCDIFK